MLSAGSEQLRPCTHVTVVADTDVLILSPWALHQYALWRKGRCLALWPFSGGTQVVMHTNGLLLSPPALTLPFGGPRMFHACPFLKSQLRAVGKYRATKTAVMLIQHLLQVNQELATDPIQLCR